MEIPSVTVVLCLFALVIVLNYLFVDDVGEKRAKRVDVTDMMISRVREVAPELSVEAIRNDLMRTGDVQVSVERYLSGALRNPDLEEMFKREVLTSSELGSKKSVSSAADEASVESEGPFNGLTYEQVKQQMIKCGRENIQRKFNRDIEWIN